MSNGMERDVSREGREREREGRENRVRKSAREKTEGGRMRERERGRVG